MHKFERLGAQASIELQAAAQKVARENTQLRMLLRRHGVTSTEIEVNVHGIIGDTSGASSTLRSSIATTFTPHDLVFPGAARSGPAHEKKALVWAPLEPRCHPTLSAANPGNSNASTLPTTPDPTTQSPSCQPCSNSAFSPPTLQRPPPEAGAQDVGQDESNRQAPTGSDATSCETAAWIIANLRGLDDAEDVRAELGCPSTADCTVKNLAVFHAMDR